jgi:hypothetical protein
MNEPRTENEAAHNHESSVRFDLTFPLFDQRVGDADLSEALGTKLFRDYANLVDGEKSFKKMDADGNDSLDRKELADASKTFPVAAELLKDFARLEGAHNEEHGSENEGITAKDLETAFRESIKNSVFKDGFDVSGEGVRVKAERHPDLSLHSLEIIDLNRDVHVNWRDGQFSMSRKSPANETKNQNSEARKRFTSSVEKLDISND